MKALKILIADDHPLICLGLHALLEAQPGWSICADAVSGSEAIRLALKHRPDVVITSISLPEINGLDAARQIRRDSPETEVVILTQHSSDKLVAEAYAAGVLGYVLKTDNLRLLIAAVETVAQHRPFFSGSVSGIAEGGQSLEDAIVAKERRTRRLLTPREREIVQRISEGQSNKEIAAALGISAKTVDSHRTNIMRRLQLRSVIDLVRYAIRETLIAA
jgi:DNA-binding NarL/FixJ family response regulator